MACPYENIYTSKEQELLLGHVQQLSLRIAYLSSMFPVIQSQASERSRSHCQAFCSRLRLCYSERSTIKAPSETLDQLHNAPFLSNYVALSTPRRLSDKILRIACGYMLYAILKTIVAQPAITRC